MPKAQTTYGEPSKNDTSFGSTAKAGTGFAKTFSPDTGYEGNSSLTAVHTYNESGITYAELLIPYIGRSVDYNRNSDKDDTDFEGIMKAGQSYAPVTKEPTEYS